MSCKTPESEYRLRSTCRACGFDDADPAVWTWWCGLPAAERKTLVRMTCGAAPAMATFTDIGINEQSISARGTTFKSTSAARNGRHRNG